MAPRRRELLWRRLPPVGDAAGGGAVRCACDGDAIDFAVLQENKTARIRARLRRSHRRQLRRVGRHAYAAACTYTPPPPPPDY